MRIKKGIFFAVLPAIVIAAWLVWQHAVIHRLYLDTYFKNGSGLRKSAPVAVDGIVVGSVERITIHPELGEHPVQVSMTIQTEQALNIPADSVARLETQGILGPTIVDIDTRQATGPVLKTGGTLKNSESEPEASQATRAIEKIGTQLIEELKNAQTELKKAQKKDSAPPSPQQH